MTTDTDTVAALNRLIQACRDDEDGFRQCADAARGAPLRELLVRRADACRQATAELQALVQAEGGDATDKGSAAAAVQRGWQTVKASVTGSTDASLLAEAERGERELLERLAKALQGPLSAPARHVVERQQQEAQDSQARLLVLIEHDKV